MYRKREMTVFQDDLCDVGVCLADLHFSPLYAGGALRFQRYASGLAKRGINMRVFTPAITNALIARQGLIQNPKELQHRHNSTGNQGWPLFEILDGLPIQRTKLPEGWRRRPAYYQRLIRFCEEHRTEVAAVQLNSLHYSAYPWIRKLRRIGIPITWTCTVLGELSSTRWRRALQRIYRRFPINLMDQAVVSSQVMRLYLEELGVSIPIQVIPNGVDLVRFHPIENDEARVGLRRRLGLKADATVILAVGAIVARKGVDVLVDAFARLHREYPKAMLVLVGPYDRSADGTNKGFYRELRQKVDSTIGQNRVVFVGSALNVEDYMRSADLYVLASRREGMPNGVLEAMACGLPVILTPFVGLSEDLGVPGTHYVLAEQQADSLAVNMRGLIADFNYRKFIGQNARQWVEKTLDLNWSLDKYAALYRELADRNQRH